MKLQQLEPAYRCTRLTAANDDLIDIKAGRRMIENANMPACLKRVFFNIAALCTGRTTRV